MDIISVNLDGCVSILCKMYPSYGIKNILKCIIAVILTDEDLNFNLFNLVRRIRFVPAD